MGTICFSWQCFQVILRHIHVLIIFINLWIFSLAKWVSASISCLRPKWWRRVRPIWIWESARIGNEVKDYNDCQCIPSLKTKFKPIECWPTSSRSQDGHRIFYKTEGKNINNFKAFFWPRSTKEVKHRRIFRVPSIDINL